MKVADIDKKRIISISDGEKSMPVYWGIAAKDIKYNNAIIMATVIARRIDKQNLWDGLLHFKESFKYFTIKSNSNKFVLEDINDNMIFDKRNPINFVFTENIDSFNINAQSKKILSPLTDTLPIPTAPRLPFSATALYAKNIGDNVIYIELRNPINIGDGTFEDNIGAFNVLVTVGTTTYYPNIINISLDNGVNDILLTLDSDIMKNSTQVITVTYDGNVGTFEDSANGGKIAGFQTSFNYATDND